MRVITALEIQKRNKERVNVYLDGEYGFSVNIIDAVRLKKGQALSDNEIAALYAEDAVAKAVDSAVRFLAYRPRSTSEVRRNLKDKEIDEGVIDTTLERLSGLGYLDDEAFARFWVQNRTAFKPLGLTALRYELRQKGVEDAIIQDVLSEVDASESAYKAAVQQARRLRGADYRTFRTKLSSFLQRRGFTYEIIQDVVTRLCEELNLTDDPGDV